MLTIAASNRSRALASADRRDNTPPTAPWYFLDDVTAEQTRQVPMPKTAPRTPRTRLIALLLPLLAVLLSACTMVKLAYNQLDTLLYWRLDAYVAFTREQTPRVHASLAQFQQWHRHTQLPAYADLLQRIRPRLAESISPEQACTVFDQVRSVVDTTLDPAHWTLAWLATELSDEQLRHIEKKQASTDADWRKEWLVNLTPEQLLDARFEQTLSRAEMLYGSLAGPQKAALRMGLAASSFDAPRSYAEHQRREHDLLNVLHKIHADKLDTEPARALLKAYMARAMLPPDLADQRYAQTLVREGCAAFSRLHNATTPAQRAQAADNVDRYASEFRQLAVQR